MSTNHYTIQYAAQYTIQYAAHYTIEYANCYTIEYCHLNPRMTKCLLGSDAVTRVELHHPLDQILGIFRDIFPLLALHL